MDLKDHYTILELSPSASMEEVKKAYRRLAHQYHPDKKGNDPYAAAQFAAVKEAYETLTNPAKKEYYLQQRWYARSQGRLNPEEVLTPVVILKKILELDKYVSRLDIHRTDQASLAAYLDGVFSDRAIETLNAFRDRVINTEIVTTGLRISRHLAYPLNLPLLSLQLKKIETDPGVSEKIDRQLAQSRSASRWEKRKVWLILLLAIAICLLIYWAG